MKRRLLDGLPPLPQRVQEIRRGAGAAATGALENDRRAAASQVGRLCARAAARAPGAPGPFAQWQSLPVRPTLRLPLRSPRI